MTFRQFAGIVELRTKIVSLSTFFLGLLYALWTHGGVSPIRAFLLLAAALAVDMGTTGFNSYFDWYRNVDDPRFNRETDKVLVHEGVDPGAALATSLSCFGVATLLGAILVALAGPVVLLAGGASLLAGFLYSGGPRPISSTPFGELLAGGFLGSVFFLVTVFILTGSADGPAALASLPQGLAIGSILSANNACDMQGDTAAGRRTLAIVLGARLAPYAIFVQGLGGLILLGLLGATGILPPLMVPAAIAAFLPILFVYRIMIRHGFSHGTKRAAMKAVSRAFLLQTLAQASGLGIAVLSRLS